MENDNRGRVVGIIHGGRELAGAAQSRPPYRPRALRLVARPDRGTAKIIENALNVLYSYGHLAAIDYLVEARVPLRTISRVLWKPQFRRAGGADADPIR